MLSLIKKKTLEDPEGHDIVLATHYCTGGSLLYLQKLAEALEKRRVKISYILPRGTVIGISGSTSCSFILKDPSTSPRWCKTKIIKYSFHLSKYLHNSIALRPGRRTKVVHLLFPFYLTDMITIKRLKKRGVKVVLTVHEVLPHNPFLGGRLDLILLKRMYNMADLLLVHNESLRRELLNFSSISQDKVKVVPHGYFDLPVSNVEINILRKKYNIPDNRRVLLFYGTIRDNKGLDVLLESMRYLKKEFFLLIAGARAGLKEKTSVYYMNLIEKNGLSASVHWIDRYISDGETAEVFKICDAVVLPYTSNFHAQSGVLSLSINYEKPSVVCDVGGIGETVRRFDLGIVVEPESPVRLQEGIISLFNEKRRFGFRRYKEENSWDSVVGRLTQLYESIKA